MYINFMSVENKNVYVSWWLLLITFLVGIMIVVGGLTRLTDSGLSITKWDLFTGILPPLTLNDWEKSFSFYKKIPEYKLINSTMNLEEFKTIYWWEYIHRLLGRLIGLLFLFPLLYFTLRKTIEKKSLISFYLILFLILLQGLVGWYMVKSGLTERVDVSHYRLSIHLTLAFIIFILLFWQYLEYRPRQFIDVKKKLPFKLPLIFMICLIFQISLGGLVSGLDAAQIYQTWPKMNENFFPNDSNYNDLLSLKLFDTPSLLQFMHRNIAYFIFLLFFFIAFLIFKYNNFVHLRKTALLVFAFLILQIFLGILTILSGAQIILASMHQIGSIFLIATSLVLVFKNSKN